MSPVTVLVKSVTSPDLKAGSSRTASGDQVDCPRTAKKERKRAQKRQEILARLDAIQMPENIPFWPTESILNLLEIDPRTLRRYASLLRQNFKRDFDHKKWEGGYSPRAFRMLLLYIRLTAQGMNSVRALKEIREILREKGI